MQIANVAHAGDGNLHPLILFDRSNPDESAAARKAGEEVLDTCLALGGTISGEHGIGLEKLGAMRRMFSPADLATMRRVKQVFDPDDVLNPGKLLPPDVEVPKEKSAPVAKKVASQTIHEVLAEIVGAENLKTGEEVMPYQLDGLMPNVVVSVSTTDQVSQAIGAGNQYQLAIVPWGSGSKQQAGPCLSAGDIIISMKKMKQIVDLDKGDSTVRVEAGVVNRELQKELAKYELFFPLEPLFRETSTIGGQLASNDSGPRRLMYGTARDLVLGLTVVTPTGDIIHPGGKTVKNVAGLDLCKMFIGSWGTLGVITEAVLRLFPLPEVNKSLCLVFPDVEDAFRLVSHLLNSVLLPSAIELIDWVASRYLEFSYGSPLKKGQTLLMVNVEGGSEAIERHLEEISAMAEANRASLKVTVESEKATEAWNAYRRIHQSVLNKVPPVLIGKASVPISRSGDMYKALKEVGDKYSVEIGITAHCGNGILYAYIPSEKDDVLKAIDDLKQAAIRLGGFFVVEVAPLWVRKGSGVWSRPSTHALMQRLKTALDPNSILSPGKVVGGQY